jgi:putative transcription factor
MEGMTMLCEMCSSPNVAFKIDVEGSRLNVCDKCSKYGRIIVRINSSSPSDKKKDSKTSVVDSSVNKKTESVQLIKPDFAKIVRTAREKTGLTQEEFSKRINERESIVNKIESGHMKPDLLLARKLEKSLKISIVENVEIESSTNPGEKKKGPGGLTLGDLIGLK